MINNEEQENKIKFQRQVIQMLYEYKFDNIIYLIQEKYPSYENNNPNIIYILMKPLEWIFLIVLYLFDKKPENRINLQYIGKKAII